MAWIGRRAARHGSRRCPRNQLERPLLLLAAVVGIRGALAQDAEGQPRREPSPPIPLTTTTRPTAPQLPGGRSTPVPRAAAMTPVAALDLQRYSGAWYEIARIPNRFQRHCARHTIAEYSLRSNATIEVRNQCIRRNGSVDQATGIARLVDTSSQAKLKVSLVSFLGWRPFWGDYWVIGLDTGYRWAVVGSPDRRYGWVLARSPQLDEPALAAVRQILERNGYGWSQFTPSDTRLEGPAALKRPPGAGGSPGPPRWPPGVLRFPPSRQRGALPWWRTDSPATSWP